MKLELILWAICNGALISGLMDGAFPRYFDNLPKPFGCSKCMAFWTTTLYIAVRSIVLIPMINYSDMCIPFVAFMVAAFGYRTFRLL